MSLHLQYFRTQYFALSCASSHNLALGYLCDLCVRFSGEVREEMIEDFMRDDSDKFLFLLSTRAGGLGLNLQKANWYAFK